jgi:hypothetical protein
MLDIQWPNWPDYRMKCGFLLGTGQSISHGIPKGLHCLRYMHHQVSKHSTALTVEVFMTTDNSENFEDTWGSLPVDLANSSLP